VNDFQIFKEKLLKCGIPEFEKTSFYLDCQKQFLLCLVIKAHGLNQKDLDREKKKVFTFENKDFFKDLDEINNNIKNQKSYDLSKYDFKTFLNKFESIAHDLKITYQIKPFLEKISDDGEELYDLSYSLISFKDVEHSLKQTQEKEQKKSSIQHFQSHFKNEKCLKKSK